MTKGQARKKLKALGNRRERQAQKDNELQDAVTEALKETEGVISVTEAASLLGLNRSTIYEVYRKKRTRVGIKRRRAA